MMFNSLHFLVFFPIVIIIYFSLPHRFRWFLLLISSYYFYMSWKAEYAILILISTVIDYFAAIAMSKHKEKKKRIKYLLLSIFANLGMLFAFKYFNFFSDSTRLLLEQFTITLQPMTLKVLLPVGISFYTFQTLSYTIEVYRGKIKPERHFGIFAVYVSFFPQLVAGPIERAQNLLHQFYKKQSFDYIRVTDGLKLMLWGFFKKIVIADRLAYFVNEVYGSPFEHSGFTLIIATLFFSYQIYCDFSGYSDIAIGASQIMGISLMDNFKRPYYSRSVSEFWKRWHISLSSWFRDYLYIPLGGNRVSVPRWYLNLMVVFLVSGLWHGANWTFVVWGGIHGSYLVISILTQKFRTRFAGMIGLSKNEMLHSAIKIIITFILVNIAWIFFRAETIGDAFYVLINIFRDLTFENISTISQIVSWNSMFLSLGLICFLEIIHLLQEQRSVRQFFRGYPIYVRWPVYMILIWSIIFLGNYESIDFIYFQF